jgi:hypothetical protein
LKCHSRDSSNDTWLGLALGVAWIVGLLSAILAYAIDLDHPYCLWRDGIPITWETLSRQACRDWHFLVVAGAGIFLVFAAASSIGWIIVRSKS